MHHVLYHFCYYIYVYMYNAINISYIICITCVKSYNMENNIPHNKFIDVNGT